MIGKVGVVYSTYADEPSGVLTHKTVLFFSLLVFIEDQAEEF